MPLVDVFIIALGLVAGSFLNVCIHRLPRRESIVRPRSRCPHCQAPIRWWENIPVFSYALLRGACRHCSQPISWVYPGVEIFTALLFYSLFLKYGLDSALLANMVFFGMLVALIFIDLFERLLPNVITLTGVVIGFAVAPWQSSEFFRHPQALGVSGVIWSQYLDSAFGILMGGGFLWGVAEAYRRVKKIEGMGFGDIKMMAMVGAFVGWRYAWLTILLGSLLGALVGAGYIYAAGKGRRYELPFGSFLGAGAIASTLWGRDLLAWYFGKLG